uniref:Transmembrane protein n=1 Tax=Globisporangium ultimum (strain ATCC 200006 / CBS 805.95 / DAOM BR144) TaxID=431595 RepID=K3WZY7_GLOUD
MTSHYRVDATDKESVTENDVVDFTKSIPAFQSNKSPPPAKPDANSHGHNRFSNRQPNADSVTYVNKNRLPLSEGFTLLRRLCIFAAAILYLHTCLSACFDAIHVLQGAQNPVMDFKPYESRLIGGYAGTTTIRKSALIAALGNGTSPCNGTMYLEKDEIMFTPCKSVMLPYRIYDDSFQRAVYSANVRDVAYNITYLNPNVSELVMPVVDCSSSAVVFDDLTSVRFFFLTRKVDDPDDVYLVTITLSTQEYRIPAMNEKGSAGVSTIAIINDMRATSVDHYFTVAPGYPFLQPTLEVYTLEGVTSDSYWLLRSIPRDPLTDYPKQVVTACRTGFYVSSENEQANFRNVIWELSQDPLTVLTMWQWYGRPVLHDSWAWVHFLHFLLAFDVIVNLIVLLMVIYRNFRAKKLWIGDAFVAVSTTLWMRSSLVVLSWWISGFWSLLEFCLYTGNELANTPGYFLYPAIMRADLLALYFCFIGFIGNVLHERIDPVFTIALFFISFEERMGIAKLFPGLLKTIVTYSTNDYSLAMSDVDEETLSISPMRFWSIHHLPRRDSSFVMALLFPVFSTFVFVIVYVALRKTYRHFFPDKLLVQKVTGFSENEERLIELKRNLTLFEIATGAALQNRYGVVADYDNCVYIKGVKFASADGIYSSGYVIANGKFLVQTDDLVSILLMKLSTTRFRNVFVYDVEGSAVKQTARLVYPHTISYTDLLNLNVNILA